MFVGGRFSPVVTKEMFVLSSEQLQQLFKGRCGGTLLDIGAGSGHITSELMQCFDQARTCGR